jgi:hypothetical protein
MEVTDATDDWPERGVRERCWLTPSQAMGRIEDPGLREIMRAVSARQAG